MTGRRVFSGRPNLVNRHNRVGLVLRKQMVWKYEIDVFSMVVETWFNVLYNYMFIYKWRSDLKIEIYSYIIIFINIIYILYECTQWCKIIPESSDFPPAGCLSSRGVGVFPPVDAAGLPRLEPRSGPPGKLRDFPGGGTQAFQDLTYIYIYRGYIYWLVVSTPLKNMKVKWGGLSHILWKIKNVPNHQPVYHVGNPKINTDLLIQGW